MKSFLISDATKNKKYPFLILGGVLFLLFINSNSLFLKDRLINNIFIFLSGVIYVRWILFWYKNNFDQKNKKIFLLTLSVTVLCSFYFMTLGNKLGEAEKIVFGFLPFLIIFPIYSFLVNHKNDMLFRIIAILVAISAIGIVIISDLDNLKSKRLLCNFKNGDFYNNTCRIDNSYTLKKSLYGIGIEIPRQYGYAAILKKRENGNLTGKIISLAIDNGYKGEVTLFTDKLFTMESVQQSIIPFVVTDDENNSDSYLGLFELSNNKDLVIHTDSYFIGRNIQLGDVTLAEGFYNNFVTQKFFDPSENTNKEIQLKVGGLLNKFYPNADCQEYEKVVERTRGDGQSYKVCIFENGNQCETETYKKGQCPIDGVPITDTESEEERYCLVTGGWTSGVTDTPSGCFFLGNERLCRLKGYYNGKCEKTEPIKEIDPDDHNYDYGWSIRR